MSEQERSFPVTADLDEHEVWKSFAEPLLHDLKPNVLSICEYGVTEMVNNVKDHTTVLLLRLFGDESAHLVSRSQAKRLLARLENFKTVILDFKGIPEIGPAFADEVFRVFQRTHPEIRIVPLNASENVNQMILRALTRNGEIGGQP